MDRHSTKLLSMLAVAFINMLFAMAILQVKDGSAPRWVLLYFIAVAFNGALYFRRRLWLRRYQRRGIYRGLGYTAAVLGALFSALFFSVVGTGMALPLTILVWIVLAVAAYFLYRVNVLHLEEEEEVLLPLWAVRIPV